MVTTTLREQILKILKATPNQTAVAIARQLRSTVTQVDGELGELEANGLASSHLASGDRYWLPTENALNP